MSVYGSAVIEIPWTICYYSGQKMPCPPFAKGGAGELEAPEKSPLISLFPKGDDDEPSTLLCFPYKDVGWALPTGEEGFVLLGGAHATW